MQITLTPDQEALIKSQADARGFASVEEAARQLLLDKLAELELEADSLTWAKPLVDEGLAEIDRGESLTREQYRDQIDALTDSLAAPSFGK